MPFYILHLHFEKIHIGNQFIRYLIIELCKDILQLVYMGVHSDIIPVKELCIERVGVKSSPIGERKRAIGKENRPCRFV